MKHRCVSSAFYEGDDPQARVPRRALPVQGATLAPMELFFEGEALRALLAEGATLAPTVEAPADRA